jgi:hypothetical protein
VHLQGLDRVRSQIPTDLRHALVALLWQAVQARTRTGPARGTRTGKGRTPRTLFGAGTLRCFACGAPIVGVNAERYGCSVHKDRGSAVCANGRTVMREIVDRRLVAELRDELLAPDALREVRAEVKSLLADAARQGDTNGDARRRRHAELDAEIARLVDAVAAIGISPALQQRLAAAEGERAELARAAATTSAPPDVDKVLSTYRAMILRLQEALESEEDRQRTRTILADMLGPVSSATTKRRARATPKWRNPPNACCCKPWAGLWDWLRGLDLNQRPLGYEPNELPDCSTPRQESYYGMELARCHARMNSPGKESCSVACSGGARRTRSPRGARPGAAPPGAGAWLAEGPSCRARVAGCASTPASHALPRGLFPGRRSGAGGSHAGPAGDGGRTCGRSGRMPSELTKERS